MLAAVQDLALFPVDPTSTVSLSHTHTHTHTHTKTASYICVAGKFAVVPSEHDAFLQQILTGDEA